LSANNVDFTRKMKNYRAEQVQIKARVSANAWQPFLAIGMGAEGRWAILVKQSVYAGCYRYAD
jgi:hypothetical protein